MLDEHIRLILDCLKNGINATDLDVRYVAHKALIYFITKLQTKFIEQECTAEALTNLSVKDMVQNVCEGVVVDDLQLAMFGTVQKFCMELGSGFVPHAPILM